MTDQKCSRCHGQVVSPIIDSGCDGCVVAGDQRLDTRSSVSRQHYIDTGRYLPVGEHSR